MKLSAILAPLIAAGVPGDVILATVKAFEEQHDDALEQGREKARARWQKWKSNQPANVSKRLPTLANDSCGGVTRVEDISSNKQIDGKKEEKKDSAPKARGDLEAFRSELSPTLDAERIEALIAVRRKKGATFSAYAGRLLSKALSACPDAAIAADEMVLRNWTGIKPEWLESKVQHRATSPPKKLTQGESLRNMARNAGIIDDTGAPIQRLETSDRDRENTGSGDVIRFAVAGNHGR